MEIIQEIVTGLGTAFEFVPTFVGAIVEAAQNLFLETVGDSTKGTVILGIVLAVVGVSLTISIMRYCMRLLRLKRRA